MLADAGGGDRWRVPARLGVGTTYIPGFDEALYQNGAVDFVEITPEVLCRPQPGGGMNLVPSMVAAAQAACGDLPIVVHGVELSIGSAGQWNNNYIAMLVKLAALWPFRWHSEHLHFQTVSRDGVEIDIGVPLPLPLTDEAVVLVADRAADMAQRFGLPFLLENGAHYLGLLPRDPDIAGEEEFLNRIAQAGNCGILLDLHNLYCNAVNTDTDPYELIDQVALDRVIEIHVAGGHCRDGYRLDAHDSCVPDVVWDMLDYTLPRCPNIAGAVFEVMDIHAWRLGRAAIEGECARLRVAWDRTMAVNALSSS